MIQIKTVVYQEIFRGFSDRKIENFDAAVNQVIQEIPGTVTDIKFQVAGTVLIAMIIYETNKDNAQ